MLLLRSPASAKTRVENNVFALAGLRENRSFRARRLSRNQRKLIRVFCGRARRLAIVVALAGWRENGSVFFAVAGYREIR